MWFGCFGQVQERLFDDCFARTHGETGSSGFGFCGSIPKQVYIGWNIEIHGGYPAPFLAGYGLRVTEHNKYKQV